MGSADGMSVGATRTVSIISCALDVLMNVVIIDRKTKCRVAILKDCFIARLSFFGVLVRSCYRNVGCPKGNVVMLGIVREDFVDGRDFDPVGFVTSCGRLTRYELYVQRPFADML